MSPNMQILRSLVEQKLTAVGEEIFGLFENTIAEYQEELRRLTEVNQRRRQMLDSVLNPTVLIQKTDVQQLSLVTEVPPEQQEWNLIVDQEKPEPVSPHFEEEQWELWTSQEANIANFPSTPVSVKSEDDDEIIKSSQLNQTPTEENEVEANKVDCGGSEPASSFHPHRQLQTKTDEQNEDSEETENSDEEQTLNCKLESKPPTNSSAEQMEAETDGDNDGWSEPGINLIHIENVKGGTVCSNNLLGEHMDPHTGQKLVGSSECEATFSQKKNTRNTDLTLSDLRCRKKLYHCSVCLKTLSRKSQLEVHMKIHTGERPFSFSECGRGVVQKGNLKTRKRIHTGETPFSCSECGHRFTQKKSLLRHMKLHIGERPFSCSECGYRFTQKAHLKTHMGIHTGERPFSCVFCQKRFKRKYNVQLHMKIHTRK